MASPSYSLKAYVEGQIETEVPVEPPKMSGLRFDGSRSTVLSRQMEVGSTWTYSAWIKKTESPDFDLLSQGLASFQARLLFQSTGKFTFLGDGGNLTTSNTFDLNTWHHVVFTADNTNISISVNGGTPETGTVTSKFSQALTRIGNTESPAATIGNGYLSDVYLVDGQALDPSTFGRNYPDPGGEWGPIDSKEVLGSISDFGDNGFYLPFSDASDLGADYSGQDNDFTATNFITGGTTVYSQGTVITSGSVASNQMWRNLFDGDTTTHTNTDNTQDAYATLALPSLDWDFKVELYVISDPAGNQNIRINNTNIGVTTVHDGYQDITTYLNSAGITEINSISIGDVTNGGFNTQINFAALRIDDELVLDPFGLDTVSDTPMKNYAVFDDFATNGNLDKTASGSRAYSTIELSGKKYCEYTVTNTGSGTTLGVHSSTPGKSILIEPNGTAKIDGTPNSPDSAISYAAKDIMGLAFDVDTSTLTVYKNGVEAKTITGSSQSGWKFSATVGVSANFGQQFFAYAIPDGYEGLYKDFIIPSSIRVVDSTERRYLAFKENTLEVTGLLEENSIPNPVNIGSPPDGSTPTSYTLTFPDVFSSDDGNGQEPDQALLSGTGIVVEGIGTDSGTTYTSTSNAVFPQDPPPIPPVTMYGLRFDSERATFLEKSKTQVNSFTYSAWFKATSDKVFRLYSAHAGSPYNLLQYRGTEKVLEMLAGDGTGNLRVVTSATFEHNEWHHAVFTWDGTTGTIYANGQQVASSSLTFDVMKGPGQAYIGKYANGPQYTDGYMSDVYFADGQVLEPTDFGMSYDGTWGPLDSAVVLENIASWQKQVTLPRASEYGPGVECW